MAFKMKGSEFYGKLNLNRDMDDTSKPDGRADSSAFQKRPMRDQRYAGEEGPQLGTRKDYTRPVDQEDVNTLTRTNRRGRQRTKDISQDRADRIRRRQDMRNLRREQRDERRQLRRGEQPQEGAPTPAPAPAPVEDNVPAPAPAPVNAAGDTGGSSGSMPAVGTDERKAEYDRRGWAYDDTIPGYGKKKTPPTTGTGGGSGSESGGVVDYIKNLGSEYGLF